MDRQFEGKTALITGAARGMGRTLALKYAENGADIIIFDINEEGLSQTRQEALRYGVKVYSNVVDMSKPAEVINAIREFSTQPIHILANCAGVSTSRLLIDVEESEWDWVLNINLKSIFLLSREVAKMMIKNKIENGKIVSISSQASKIGELGNGAYCVSKAGVNMLTQVLALELAEYGISVNAVCPGYVNTEMMQEVFRKRGPIEGMTPEEYEKALVSKVPMGRMAESEEIASLMVFLSSNEANYITGMAITIAGGKTLL
jgi:NAD(P)-dependent dehydrogenase (short-subunit alcohol dehydrogenase family)